MWFFYVLIFGACTPFQVFFVLKPYSAYIITNYELQITNINAADYYFIVSI
jgi:hypothetical protein